MGDTRERTILTGLSPLVNQPALQLREAALLFGLGTAGSLFWLASPLLADPVQPKEAAVYSDHFLSVQTPLSGNSEKKLKALTSYYRGAHLESRGSRERAFEAYSEALGHDASNVYLARNLARLARAMGKTQNGLQILRESLRRNQGDPQAYLDLARFCESVAAEADRAPDNEGEGEAAMLRVQALDVAQMAGEKFPSWTPAYWQQLRIHLAEARKDLAQEMVTKAIAREGESVGYWLEMGRLAQQAWPLADRETYDKHVAIINDIYAKALASADEDAFTLDRVADYYSQTSQYDRAVELYQKVIEQRPDMLVTREKLARLYGVLEQPDKKLETLEALIQINPHEARLQKFIGSEYETQGEMNKAIDHYLDAIKAGESDAVFYEALIGHTIQAQRTAEALPIIKRARFLYPEADSIGVSLARAYADLRDWNGAMRTFRAIEKRGDDATPGTLNNDFYFHYGIAAREAGKLPRAAVLLRKSITIVPREEPERAAPAYNALGALWLDQDDNIDEAGELIRLANELKPDHPAHLESLGWYHFKKRAPEKAMEIFVQAETLLKKKNAPSPASLLVRMAHVHLENGDKSKAIALLERAAAQEDSTDKVTGLLNDLKSPESPESK